MQTRTRCLWIWLLVLCMPVIVHATVPLEGYFIAQESCPAVRSIKNQTNPGNITLTQGMAYEVIGKNKPNETHYLLRIKHASPTDRWVPTNCGKLLIDCRQKTADTQVPQEQEYLLAISWQPAFCETHRDKPECVSQTPERFDATHFALHGLWPQPRGNSYCNVSNRDKTIDRNRHWHLLPVLNLTDDTFERLLISMPGVASHLQRHEWIKHGTCYSPTPEEYFTESLSLLDQINSSVVTQFIAANIEATVSASDIRARFDQAFGAGAGDKVRIRCKNGMITELQINLEGEIEADTPLMELLQNADDAESIGCSQGKIDRAGFN